MKSPKINELQVLRTIAFLFVVAQHVFGGYAWRPGLNIKYSLIFDLLHVIGKPAVPMFVFLVGITLFLHSKEKRPQFAKFYQKKIKTIIIPYIFWAVVIICLNRTYSKLDNLVGTLATGSGEYHLWYMGMLIQIFAYFPLMWFVFNSMNSRKQITKNITFGIFIAACWMLSMHGGTVINAMEGLLFTNPSEVQQKLVTESPLFYSLYLVTGVRVAYNYESFVRIVMKRKQIIIGVYPFVLAYSYFVQLKTRITIQESSLVRYIDNNYTHSILYMLFLVDTILVVYLLSKYIYENKHMVYKVMNHMANYSYMGYLIHSIMIASVAAIFNYNAGCSFSTEIIIYLGTVMLSIEIPHLLGYLPYTYIITGLPERVIVKQGGNISL